MTGTIDIPNQQKSPDPTEGGGGAAPPPTSGGVSTLADRMRAAHKQVLSGATEQFPVPGWGGNLVASVVVIDDVDDWERAARAENTNAAFVARATVELLLRNVDGELEHVADGFTPEVTEILGIAAGSASAVVLELVGPHEPGKTNPAALQALADDMLAWMQGKSSSTADELRPT